MLAQAAVLANGGRAVCANSEPLGAGVRARVGMLYGRGDASAANITQIEIKGDWLTDNKAASYCGTVAELIGWGPWRNFGTGFRFDQAPQDECIDEDNAPIVLDPHNDAFRHLLYHAKSDEA